MLCKPLVSELDKLKIYQFHVIGIKLKMIYYLQITKMWKRKLLLSETENKWLQLGKMLKFSSKSNFLCCPLCCFAAIICPGSNSICYAFRCIDLSIRDIRSMCGSEYYKSLLEKVSNSTTISPIRHQVRIFVMKSAKLQHWHFEYLLNCAVLINIKALTPSITRSRY